VNENVLCIYFSYALHRAAKQTWPRYQYTEVAYIQILSFLSICDQVA